MNKTRFFLFFGVTSLLFLLTSGLNFSGSEYKVTYLGNCGFLYENSVDKVVIDPLGTEYGNYFKLPSEEVIKNIIEGTVPFDNIELLLITHIHGDHFNAKLAETFLLNHPNSKLICPQQVYQQLIDSCQNFGRIRSQLISPSLNINESIDLKLNDIAIKVIRMQHGTDRSLEGIDYSDYTEYEKTENFGYIINLKEHRIFHQGDACLKINQKALQEFLPKVDLAHLGFFDWDTTSYSILKKELHANHIVFMHGTVPAEELKNDELKEILPELIFFKKELESKQMN